LRSFEHSGKLITGTAYLVIFHCTPFFTSAVYGWPDHFINEPVPTMTITSSAAWKAIEAHRQSISPVHLRQFFRQRSGSRSFSLAELRRTSFIDFSKQRMDFDDA
jgi:hypothetical protein